jgi:hypothetical protein
MKTNGWVVAAVGLLTGSLLWPGHGAAQVAQVELARSIAQGSSYERFAAARRVWEMGPENADPPLREALVAAFREEAERYRTYRRGEAPMPDVDALGTLALVIGEYRDPRALQPFTAVLGLGPAIARGLAAFGDPAVPLLVEVVRTGERTAVVADALIALRFIAEGNGQVPLSPSSREELTTVAREGMEPKHPYSQIVWAIDLAAVLDVPELREIVQAIAADVAEVESRLENPNEARVDRVQEWAKQRLRGVPPLPRWEAIGRIGR